MIRLQLRNLGVSARIRRRGGSAHLARGFNRLENAGGERLPPRRRRRRLQVGLQVLHGAGAQDDPVTLGAVQLAVRVQPPQRR